MVDYEFGRRVELDYSRPMRGRRTELAIPREDFRTRCQDGEQSVCLRATMEHNDRGSIWLRLLFECRRSGDELSCRYIEWAKLNFEDDPPPFPLSSTQLRHGCTAGIGPECNLLARSENVADARFGAELSCLRAARHCLRAANSYLNDEPRSEIRGQYYLEVECQTFGGEACKKLSIAYRAGLFEEPRRGRGRDLERYVCRYYEKHCPRSKTK